MTKIETFEYEFCFECPHFVGIINTRCELTGKYIDERDGQGEIPDWCPLPDKKEKYES